MKRHQTTARRAFNSLLLTLTVASLVFGNAIRALPQQATPRAAPRTARAQSKPNVLFIAADDLGTHLSTYGNPIVKTPNVERLARRGVQFNRAYSQFPVCNPSRTSLLSGLRPDTTGVKGNATPPRSRLGERAVFLPEYFKQHDYFTARVCKIAHSPFEDALKWDVAEDPTGARKGKLEYISEEKTERGGAEPIAYKITDNRDADEQDGQIARRAAELLRENKDKQFFIAAGLHKPHLPWVAPKKYFDMYPPDKIELPRTPAADVESKPVVARRRNPLDANITDEKRRQAIAAYYAATTFMDAQLGVILDQMDELKLWDNTVVIFFGDHGFHLGEHGGLWRKLTPYEEAARAPLIVHAPGARQGAKSERLVEFVDIYQTLAELCRLPAPRGMEGTSFAPLLTNPNLPWKRAAFVQVPKGENVRSERYSYTEWNEGKAAELYDRQTDPHEYYNLAADMRHATVKSQMQSLLRAGWRAAKPPK